MGVQTKTPPTAQNNEPKDTAMQSSVEARAVAEVQSQYVIAKKFPRNQHQAYMDIVNACKRPSLAETGLYAYPRGGQMVTGPSIRLAEMAAQNYGNIDCGVREISQSNGVSVAEAYAIDLQTNTRITKIFHVPHTRDTKKGKVKLTDSRDIYEMVANQGSRRLRACILGIIPGDIIESAIDQCKRTMESSEVPVKEQINRLVKAFDEIGIKVEHIEKRLCHKLEAIIPQEITSLRSVFRSIKDGMASREDFFEISSIKSENAQEDLKALIEKNKEAQKKNNENSLDKVASSESGD